MLSRSSLALSSSVLAMALLLGVAPAVSVTAQGRSSGALDSLVVKGAAAATQSGKLVYSVAESQAATSHYDLYVAERNGTGVRKFGRGDHPTFSPDGKLISYRRDVFGPAGPSGDIVTQPTDGGAQSSVTAPFASSDDAFTHNLPTWRSDQSAIVYNNGNGTVDAPAGLYETAGAGLGQQILPREFSLDCGPFNYDVFAASRGSAPSNLLAYDRRCYPASENEIRFLGTDTVVRGVTLADHGSWTPDGRVSAEMAVEGGSAINALVSPQGDVEPFALSRWGLAGSPACTVDIAPWRNGGNEDALSLVFAPDGQTVGFSALGIPPVLPLPPGTPPMPAPACTTKRNGIYLADADPGSVASLVIPQAGDTIPQLHDIQCTPGNCLTGVKIVKSLQADLGKGKLPTTFSYSGSASTNLLVEDDPFGPPVDVSKVVRLAPGSRTITEAINPSWDLTAITCNGGTPLVNLATRTVTLNVGASAGVITCVFSSEGKTPANSAPTARGDTATYVRSVERPSRQLPIDVLANDFDIDVEPITLTAVSNPPHGIATIQSGQILYVADAGTYQGADSFTYTIKDPQGATSTGTVNLTVRPDPTASLHCRKYPNGLDTCKLRVGDIVLERSPPGGWLNHVTRKWGKSYWTHAGIVVQGPGSFRRHPVIVEAVGPGVIKRSIDDSDFVKDEYKPAAVRVGVPADRQVQAASTVDQYLGYDYQLFPRLGRGTVGFYCSALVWRTYADHGVDLELPDGIRNWVTPEELAEAKPGGVPRRYIHSSKAGESGTVSVPLGSKVLLTDPQGRSTGTDADGTVFENIPGAAMETSDLDVSISAPGLGPNWFAKVTPPTNTGSTATVDYVGDESGTALGTRTIVAGTPDVFSIGSVANHPPSAVSNVSVTSRTATFHAGASTDPDGSVVSYRWDFDGNGTIDKTTTTPTTTFTYALAAADTTYDALLTVVDDDGATRTTGMSALTSTGTAFVIAPDVKVTQAEGSDTATFVAAGLAGPLTWDFGDGSALEVTTGPTATHSYAEPGPYDVTVWASEWPTAETGFAVTTVTVAEPSPPTLNPDLMTVREKTSTVFQVLDNDDDPDNDLDSDSVTVTSGPAHGAVEVVPSGIRYTPTSSYRGTDTFTYQACDKGGRCATATVTVTVTPFYAPFPSVDALINRQFVDFAGRSPTSSELATWRTRLSSGGTWTPAKFADDLLDDPYWAPRLDPITRLFRAYFLRLPDPSGLKYWVNRSRTGTSLRQISASFAGSSEFKTRYGTLSNADFVKLVYNNVLGRPPDSAGLSYWTGVLAQRGSSRGAVMIGFSESNEYKRKTIALTNLVDVYMATLQRIPKVAEVAIYSDMTTAAERQAAIGSIFDLPQYVEVVN